jgi:2-polyprenyl-6-methoxyphenol hydroxylase-like FAD-dependent oxidoreductase
MANFPEIRTVVIDRKDGPLEVGQADGVACRTVELMEAFGLADRLVNEGYWVNDVAFWRPDPQDRGLVGDAPRDRQPGAHARLPFGSHGAVGQQAAAVLRPPRQRHVKAENPSVREAAPA